MADDPKVPNVNNFKDAVSLSQKIAENLKANEEIIKRTNSLLNDNSKFYSKISESLQKISKGLEEENARLEKAKRLEIEKKDITKLSNTISNKANEIHNQNEKIQKRINHLNKQAINEAKNKVDYAKKGVEVTRDQILSQEIQLEYDKKHNNLSATEIENRVKSIRAAEEKLKQQEEELTKTKSILEGREKELNVLKEAQVANGKIVDELKEQSQKAAEIAKHYTGNKLALEAVNGITGKLSKIPIAKNFIDASKASEAMTNNIEKGKSGIGTLFKGLAAGIKGLETASVVLTIFQAALSLFNLIKDAMFGADKQVTSLAKNLSISKEEARILRDNFQGVSNSVAGIYGTMPNLIDAQLQLSELSNATTMFSRNQLETQVELTKLLGLSVEEATKLQSNFVLSKGEASEQVDIVYDQVAAFSNQNKILFNGRKILSEMSKVSGQILSTFRGSTEALAKAVMRAEAVGMTLEQSRKAAQGLLNFESSIESELEAELLTGKQLNLERARGLALQGDYAGVAEEIASQVGDFYEFGKLNVLQQEALAQSVGMQADELADVLKRREFITKEVQGELDRTRALAKEARDKKETDKANALEKRALAIEQGVLDGKSLKTAQESVDAQEKFAQALEIVKSKFTELFTGEFVDKLGDTLIKLANFLQDFINSVMNRGLWATLTGGIQEEAQSRVRTEYTALEAKKAEAGGDVTKIAEIQKQQEDLYKQAKEASKMENQTHLAAVGTGAGVGATIGTLIFPGVGTAIGAVLGGYIGKALATEDYTEGLQAPMSQTSEIGAANNPTKTLTVEAGAKDYTKGLQSPIPQMAEGGIITRPTKVIAGEAGAEAIIPLTSPTAKTYLGNTNSDNSELISLMKDFIQAARAPKEIVIQNNMAIDSQKWALESSKHNVQFNT